MSPPSDWKFQLIIGLGLSSQLGTPEAEWGTCLSHQSEIPRKWGACTPHQIGSTPKSRNCVSSIRLGILKKKKKKKSHVS